MSKIRVPAGLVSLSGPGAMVLPCPGRSPDGLCLPLGPGSPVSYAGLSRGSCRLRSPSPRGVGTPGSTFQRKADSAL